MHGVPQGWADANRRNWDERVPVHLRSIFYDVDGFRAGRPSLEPFEIDELGALGDLRLAHLQCHIGLDTLDLVRPHPTLKAVGLDFSAPAVRAARELASSLGLAGRSAFVEADVLHSVEALGREAFDVVYTGKGSLCWLPALDSWAEQCAGLLRPGGWLYVCEFHPVAYALGDDAPIVADDYFRPDPWIHETAGSYADPDAPTVHNTAICFNHPLPELLSALVGAGFSLRFFHEWDYTLFAMKEWLVKGDDGRYRWPPPRRGSAITPRLPLMYSLKAVRSPSS